MTNLKPIETLAEVLKQLYPDYRVETYGVQENPIVMAIYLLVHDPTADPFYLQYKFPAVALTGKDGAAHLDKIAAEAMRDVSIHLANGNLEKELEIFTSIERMIRETAK